MMYHGEYRFVFKDTSDIVEEILILETALLADLIQCLQEQCFSLWPVILQENYHMTKGQIIMIV